MQEVIGAQFKCMKCNRITFVKMEKQDNKYKTESELLVAAPPDKCMFCRSKMFVVFNISHYNREAVVKEAVFKTFASLNVDKYSAVITILKV